MVIPSHDDGETKDADGDGIEFPIIRPVKEGLPSSTTSGTDQCMRFREVLHEPCCLGPAHEVNEREHRTTACMVWMLLLLMWLSYSLYLIIEPLMARAVPLAEVIKASTEKPSKMASTFARIPHVPVTEWPDTGVPPRLDVYIVWMPDADLKVFRWVQSVMHWEELFPQKHLPSERMMWSPTDVNVGLFALPTYNPIFLHQNIETSPLSVWISVAGVVDLDPRQSGRPMNLRPPNASHSDWHFEFEVETTMFFDVPKRPTLIGTPHFGRPFRLSDLGAGRMLLLTPPIAAPNVTGGLTRMFTLTRPRIMQVFQRIEPFQPQQIFNSIVTVFVSALMFLFGLCFPTQSTRYSRLHNMSKERNRCQRDSKAQSVSQPLDAMEEGVTGPGECASVAGKAS